LAAASGVGDGLVPDHCTYIVSLRTSRSTVRSTWVRSWTYPRETIVTRAQENMLAHYVVKGRKTVQGWFFRVDAEIFHLLTACQNAHALDGGVAEIGLHHGKSFIALCLSLQLGQRAYGIDLFDSQHLNFDRSGKGDRSIVEQNLVRAGVDLSSVILDGRPSDQVSAPDILKAVGHVRFFSIDGGHWAGIVRNDLRLAEATLGECGVIALDDFLRAEWPDVSTGYFEWLRERSRPIVPLAIGCNKLYLCEERYRALYRKVLDDSSFLKVFLSTHYDFGGNDIPVYQKFAWPEGWNLRTRVEEYIKLYHPDLYVRLRADRSSRRR
jgi:hypothetical protein